MGDFHKKIRKKIPDETERIVASQVVVPVLYLLDKKISFNTVSVIINQHWGLGFIRIRIKTPAEDSPFPIQQHKHSVAAVTVTALSIQRHGRGLSCPPYYSTILTDTEVFAVLIVISYISSDSRSNDILYDRYNTDALQHNSLSRALH
jgi:hypothetical protein